MKRLFSILLVLLLGVPMEAHARPIFQNVQSSRIDQQQKNDQKDQKKGKKESKKKTTLDTLVVSGNNITQYGDRDVIRITRSMRKGAYNTAELLGRVPGMYWNQETQELNYLGSTKVLILVDSLEKDDSYVKKSYHLRFDKIDVIQNPHGKYEGYDVLINLHTKEDYEGYEDNLGEEIRILPTNAHDGLHLLNQWADNTFTYTKNKWNVVANYSFNLTQDGFSRIDETYVYHANGLQERTVEPRYNRSHKRNHRVSLCSDYQVNKSHSLSFVYKYEPMLESERGQKNVERTWLGTGAVDTVFQETRHHDHEATHAIGVFYRGRAKGWGFTYDFNYRFRQNRPDMALDQSSGFAYDYHYDNTMDYVWTKSEVNKKFIDGKFYVSGGHNYTWKGYRQKERIANVLLSRYVTVRHDTWAYLSYNFTDNTQLAAGFSADHNRTENFAGNSHNLDCKFSGMFYQRLSKNAFMRANYRYGSSYPSLSQVTHHGEYTDSLRWRVGNPMLKASRSQYGNVQLNLLNEYTLSFGFWLAPNLIDWVSMQGEGPDGKHVISCPVNSRFFQWDASFWFRKNIKAFSMAVSATYKKQRAQWNGINYSNDGLTGYASVGYSHDKSGFSAGLGYENYCPGLADAQGTSTQYMDYFRLYAAKRLFKGNMRVSVNWNMPISFCSSKRTTWSSSDAMYYSRTEHLANTANSIYIVVNYRIMGGKSIRHYRRTIKEED